MKGFDEIKMLVKRVDYVEVVVSEEAGYEVPKNLSDFVKWCGDIKEGFSDIAECSDDWTEGEYTLERFEVIEDD